LHKFGRKKNNQSKNAYFCNSSFETNHQLKSIHQMAEKDKGFKFKNLFLRETAADKQEKQNQKAEAVNIKTSDDYITNKSQPASGVVPEQSLVEDFVQRLQNLINQNNQAGFDFLEFTESLFEEKQNPDQEVYKTVFRIAQKIDKSLTPSRLLDSAMFYKNLVQQTADAENAKGESKKQDLNKNTAAYKADPGAPESGNRFE
jgi:hypothetical protein